MLGLDPFIVLRCVGRVEQLALKASLERAVKMADQRDRSLANKISVEVSKLFEK